MVVEDACRFAAAGAVGVVVGVGTDHSRWVRPVGVGAAGLKEASARHQEDRFAQDQEVGDRCRSQVRNYPDVMVGPSSSRDHRGLVEDLGLCRVYQGSRTWAWAPAKEERRWTRGQHRPFRLLEGSHHYAKKRRNDQIGERGDENPKMEAKRRKGRHDDGWTILTYSRRFSAAQSTTHSTQSSFPSPSVCQTAFSSGVFPVMEIRVPPPPGPGGFFCILPNSMRFGGIEWPAYAK